MRYASKNGRTFLIALLGIVLITIPIGSILLFEMHHKQKILNRFFKMKAKLEAESALHLIYHEIHFKSEEDRFRDGWTLSGQNYIYTDTDGTQYLNSLTTINDGSLVAVSKGMAQTEAYRKVTILGKQ